MDLRHEPALSTTDALPLATGHRAMCGYLLLRYLLDMSITLMVAPRDRSKTVLKHLR